MPCVRHWTAVAGSLLAVLATLDAAPRQNGKPKDPYWPDGRWRSSTPEAQGIDSNVLADAFDYVRAHGTRIHSLTIIRNGYSVLDARFFPFEANQLHDVASVTKSITTTLIGIAIGDGRLRGVSEPVLRVFGDRQVANRDDRKDRLTLEHLMTMSSGLDCEYKGGERTLREMRQSRDWVKFMLDRRMVADPGARPEYCSGGMHLLSGVLSAATGTSTLAYARHRLFAPLGIHRVAWPADPNGITHGWGDLHLEPGDMAKIGYLWLNGGGWRDRQIVPVDWMRGAIQPHRRVLTGEYGYGLWLQREREPMLFEAIGRGGQRITVLPAQNMVLAITGGAFEPGEIGEFILRASRSDVPLPSNTSATRRLRTAIGMAARPPLARPAAALPDVARRISGRRYVFPDNPLGWRAMTFRFSGVRTAGARLEFTDGRVEQRIVGLDGVSRLSPKGRFGLPVALQGRWDGPTFELDYDEVANVNAFLCRFTFDGDMATVDVKERSGELDLTLEAKSGQ